MALKILVAALALTVVAMLSSLLFFTDRITPPSEELRTLVEYCEAVRNAEDSYFRIHGKYASKDQLLGESEQLSNLVSKCQEGYCLDVQGTQCCYKIRIFPDTSKPKMASRHVSLYADETHVVRIAFGAPYANEQSPVLADETRRQIGLP